MSLLKSSKEILSPAVEDWESMYKLIREYRIIPFFENPIPGYSIQEHTPDESWFTSENLGPWDWKIECIRCGGIAYGKFLWGGKAAFATIETFRELINWRRSLPKYAPTPDQQRILDHIAQYGAISVPEVRKMFGITKSAADSLLAKLQMQTRIVTGDISRIYRGADLSYSGWQRCSFCTPESIFEGMELPIPGYVAPSLKSDLTPEESLEFLKETVRRTCGEVPDKILMRMLG